MYIPEFVWGIIGAILVEALIGIGAAVLIRKDGGKKKDPAREARTTMRISKRFRRCRTCGSI